MVSPLKPMTMLFCMLLGSSGCRSSARPLTARSASVAGDRSGLAPSRFYAASGNGKVLLLWSAPPGATAFTIYRGTKPGEEGQEPIANHVAQISYVDDHVTNGTRYYYRIALESDATAGAGAQSAEASAAPSGADPAAAFRAAVASVNSFADKSYTKARIPSYAAEHLPQPIVDDHPEWLALYEKAWQLAFKDLKQPTPGSGFVSNYIDAAFNGHIFQWDTLYMLQFAAYAAPDTMTIGSLDNFYAKQHPDGFICREIDQATGRDVLYTGTDRDAVNPPLFSWAEWRHYSFTGDRSRLASVLIPITKHYAWLREHRRLPNGGYWNTNLGAGEDDLKRNEPTSWLDMTTQQAQNALFSAFIASEVGSDGLSAFFVEEYLSLAQLLNDKFWDASGTLFSDLRADDQPTHVKTALAFWPLVAAVPTLARANALTAHLRNSSEFWRPNLVPVLAADQAGYSAEGQYWNGAVWAPINYVIVDGLQSYGQHRLASSISRVYLGNLSSSFQSTGTIWEHYAPESATGGGARDFVGWSGLGPIALLIESVLGVRVEGFTNTVHWHPTLAQRNGISNLALGSARVSLIAGPISNGARRLTMTTTLPIRVAVDTGSHQATYAVPAGTREITVPATSF